MSEYQRLTEELNQLSDDFEKNKDRMKYISHLIVENLMWKKNPLKEKNWL